MNYQFILLVNFTDAELEVHCRTMNHFFLSFRIFSDALGLLMGVRLQLVLLTGMGIFVWFMQCLYSMIV